MKALAAPIIFLCLYTSSFAEPASESETCQTGTQHEMNKCEYKLSIKADDELNATYKALRDKRGNDEENALLKNSELAWIQFRDKQCNWLTHSTEEGTIHPQVVSQCYFKATKRRIAELKEFLACRENDIFCGLN